MTRRPGELVALLSDDEREMWGVVDRAIELAEAKQASLTLAACAGRGRPAAWPSPLAALSRVTRVADPELRLGPGDRLARAGESVPASIPLTTLRLTVDAPSAVRELAASGSYDLLVIGHRMIARSRRIRRELRRTGMSVLIACPEAVTDSDLQQRRARGEPVG